MTGKKFSIQPESIEAVLTLDFEYVHGQEIDNKAVYWQQDKLIMAREFERAIADLLNVDLGAEFALFYADSIQEITFFELLETRLNELGFYTYNSDSTFEIFQPEDVDQNDPEVSLCLDAELAFGERNIGGNNNRATSRN